MSMLNTNVFQAPVFRKSLNFQNRVSEGSLNFWPEKDGRQRVANQIPVNIPFFPPAF